MAALTQSRIVKSIPGILFAYPVLANAVIHKGAIVVITSAGYAKPAVTGLTLTAVGIARDSVDNTGGSNGAVILEVEEMIAGCANSSAGDLITIADIGKLAYLVDDQTVAKTSGTNTRSLAGPIRKLEGSLVYVDFSNTIATTALTLA